MVVSRRVSYLIWYFVVRSTVYNGLPCVLPLLVLASVRLLLVFGRVFGRFLVFGRVFGRFLVFGRVFGCYNFWAVCSAVASVGRAFGRFKYCSVLLFSSCLYLYVFLPVSGFTHSFYLSRLLFSSWYLPFCLGMFYLALAYFLGRFIVLFFIFVRLSLCIRFSFTISACLFCFVLVVIFVFFCFARTLVACFSLGARLFCFVIVVVSAFCSMQCGLVSLRASSLVRCGWVERGRERACDHVS